MGLRIISTFQFEQAISPDPRIHPNFNGKNGPSPNCKSIAWSRQTIEIDKWFYVEILGSGWDLKSEQDSTVYQRNYWSPYKILLVELPLVAVLSISTNNNVVTMKSSLLHENIFANDATYSIVPGIEVLYLHFANDGINIDQ